jgi:hypothetical protein
MEFMTRSPAFLLLDVYIAVVRVAAETMTSSSPSSLSNSSKTILDSQVVTVARLAVLPATRLFDINPS